MDLVNYVSIVLGKTYLWSCSHFKNILENELETEKYITLKSNRFVSFCKKWNLNYEELLLHVSGYK